MQHDQSLLRDLVHPGETAEREGILVTKEVSERTIWDTLAVENPTNAVISARDEAEAAKKSEAQIIEIKQHVGEQDILLDCGTGYGRVAKYLLPQKPIGGYIGVDSSYEMLTLFKRHYDESEAEQRTPLLLLNADIHTLPLQTDAVDVVVVSAVFLHNHKSIVARAMAEISRVLKPGGTLLVYSSFPRGATLSGLQGHLYQFVLNLIGNSFKNGPVRYYSRREVMALLADFAELEIKPYGFTALPKTLIFLPKPLEKLWRLGLANPVNKFLERITPASLKPYFATHYDLIAKR